MHSFQETKSMPYKAEFIKDVILDVESYPEFLPWCESASILSRNKDFFTVKLQIKHKGFSESYVSKVFIVEEEGCYSINVSAISGPFSHLSNIWKVKRLNNTSLVHFSIDFEFKSKILDTVMGFMFSSLVEKMTVAFEKRADELHSLSN